MTYFSYPVYCECRGLWHVYDIQHNEEITPCYGNLDDVKYLIRYAIAWNIPVETAYRTLKGSNGGCWYDEDRFKQNLKQLKTKLKKKEEHYE